MCTHWLASLRPVPRGLASLGAPAWSWMLHNLFHSKRKSRSRISSSCCSLNFISVNVHVAYTSQVSWHPQQQPGEKGDREGPRLSFLEGQGSGQPPWSTDNACHPAPVQSEVRVCGAGPGRLLEGRSSCCSISSSGDEERPGELPCWVLGLACQRHCLVASFIPHVSFAWMVPEGYLVRMA